MEVQEKNQIFTDDNDIRLGLLWMQTFLSKELAVASKNEDPENVKSMVKDAQDFIRLFSIILNDSGEKNNRLLNEAWNIILLLNEDTYLYEREPERISWGIWRTKTSQKFDFGYTENTLESSYVYGNGVEKINEYSSPPPTIKWKLNKIIQKDILFYTASARVEEIEQVTAVPSLPKQMSSIEAGLRVLDENRGPEQWQRRPDPKRINSITQFVDTENNIIANAPILFIRDSDSVKIINDELHIDFSKFLVLKNQTLFEKQSHYIDHAPAPEDSHNEDGEGEDIDAKFVDLRPIWLIDGQHRVRGLSRNQTGAKLSIPIIIFPSDFGLKNAAKVFSEINTLQEPLTSLHKLFMQHRFKIPSPLSKRRFEAWEEMPNKHMDSRANSLSYELVAKLAADDDSVLRNKIKILDQNDSHDFYVKADQWVNYARAWFLNGGPYDHITNWPVARFDDIFKEVNNYFKAFIRTVNHTEWEDGKQRWTDSSKNKSILQSATFFKVLIDLYVDVYQLVKKKDNTICSVDDFMKILKPFKWVDWISADLKKHFSGGGEKGRSNLYIWMYDALGSKESHPKRSVMADGIKSIAGKGIKAPPAKSEIEIKGRTDWPASGKPVHLYSKRPLNARKRPEWSIEDSNKDTYNGVLNVDGENCIVDYLTKWDDMKFLRITVKWSNAHSNDGTSHIKLSNPD